MTSHLMSAGSAAGILAALDARDAEVSVGGGWGVDALLGEQTREHSDLDGRIAVFGRATWQPTTANRLIRTFRCASWWAV
jgi:hypothetical protein